LKNSTLIYCLDTLKVEKDTELYRKALELQKDVTEEGINEWTTAIKVIADVNSHNIFTKSQLADFLTLSANGIEEKRRSSDMINNVLYKMYMDVIENYESFSGSLKSNYPRIIVDVISIINHGMDTRGNKVSGIWKYYQSRRQQGLMAEEEVQKEVMKKPETISTTTTAAAADKEKILVLSNKDLAERLSQITNRDRKELEESIARLEYSDLKKVSQLCQNYNKLRRYTKLIKEGSQEEFKKEIQRELGRKPMSHQLGRAAASIRRAQTYIENILDNKFMPDTSHGINHTKHNLEYGYQLMNLIECPRRRQRNH
jgi:hypothetical protein